jgi:hypothetical protein
MLRQRWKPLLGKLPTCRDEAWVSCRSNGAGIRFDDTEDSPKNTFVTTIKSVTIQPQWHGSTHNARLRQNMLPAHVLLKQQVSCSAGISFHCTDDDQEGSRSCLAAVQALQGAVARRERELELVPAERDARA